MMIVEIVLAISDKNRASPSGKHIDLAANYGWHQVFYVCFVDFLGKAWLHWLCIL